MDVEVKMEDVYANWSSLPFEILHRIFQIADKEEEQAELCRYTLICKSWLQPAQLVLYSHVVILSLAQLKSFYKLIKKNSRYGNTVKIFQLDIDKTKLEANENVEVLRLITSLLSTYLPNLEELMDITLHSYTPILDALIESRLKKLNFLQWPDAKYKKDEIANYITCCLLLKDRLETMFIAGNTFFDEELGMKQFLFDRLYNNIHQFDKLTTIHLTIETNKEIHVLEHLIRHCKSLNSITFQATPPNTDTSNNTSVSTDEISSFIPAANIKTLDIVESSTKDLLLYVMHKFPQLNSLSMKMKNDPNRIHADYQTMNNLLNYLNNIESYSVSNIRVDKSSITESIGNYWNSVTTGESQQMGFNFRKKSSGSSQTLLDLSKEEGSSTLSTTLTYHTTTFYWDHPNDFMKRHGRFIRELRVAHEDNNLYYGLPKSFTQHTIASCPNLENLHLQYCMLKNTELHSKTDYSKQLSIDELFLDPCILYEGVLEHWSLFLPNINQLCLSKINYRIRDEQPNDTNRNPSNQTALEINMPFTEIDSIVFKGSYGFTLVKLFLPAKRIYLYYRYTSSSKGIVSELDEKEYTRLTHNHKCIYVCCKTKPEIRFEK